MAAKPSSAGGLKPLKYPDHLSPEARDRIEKEKIRASKELLPASAYDFNDQELAIRCIMRIFLAFAKEACVLRSEHGWTLDRVQREADEFLRKLTITVVSDKFPGLYQHWISNWDGSISGDVKRHLKSSPEWAQYEELLLADSPPKHGKTAQSVESNPAETGSTTRKTVLMTLLAKKDFSVHDWAKEAGVDWHTADNYLNGRAKPYQSTIGKLARALGVGAEDMPA
ncbi:MAG TPA: helix-turn-helix transcriptional regulator [Candidatus Acidoferrum sp.]|nr:helix-turn-helix transcriptional regulator [Candidatus Acidoferrum sp.]